MRIKLRCGSLDLPLVLQSILTSLRFLLPEVRSTKLKLQNIVRGTLSHKMFGSACQNFASPNSTLPCASSMVEQLSTASEVFCNKEIANFSQALASSAFRKDRIAGNVSSFVFQELNLTWVHLTSARSRFLSLVDSSKEPSQMHSSTR